MNDDPPLNVVVVTWNNADTVARCIESVRRQQRVRSRVIVVDNDSSDATPDLVKAMPDVELVETGANLGFARAANIGAGVTSSGDVLLLNPDTELHGVDALRTALSVLHSIPGAGTVGLKLLNADGSLQVSAYAHPALWREILEAFFVYRLLPHRLRGRVLLGSHWDHRSTREVGWLLGAFLLIRRATWNDCAGLTEDFHMFAEDMDWGIRSHRRGWSSIYTPEASATHLSNYSGAQRWDSATERSVASFVSYYAFLRSRYGIARVAASVAVNLAGFAWRALIYRRRMRRGHPKSAQWAHEYHRLVRFHLRTLTTLRSSTEL